MKDIFDFDINILIKDIDMIIESKEHQKIKHHDILYNCVCHLFIPGSLSQIC